MSWKVKITESVMGVERADQELESALSQMLDKVSTDDAKRLLKAAAAKPQLVKTALKFI